MIAWNHATLVFHNLFGHKKDAYQQFLKDFPRQTITLHGVVLRSMQEWIEAMHQHVHPSLHIPLIHVSTQASMASTFSLLQTKYPFLSGSTQNASSNDRLCFHYVIVNPFYVKVIIEKKFGVVEFLCDTPSVTQIIHSFTMLEIKPHWISDFHVSWTVKPNCFSK